MDNINRIVEVFDGLRNFADNDIHPIVSPENWHVYSELRDLIDKAEASIIILLKDQEAIIEQYRRADGFLAVHGWKWEGR